MKKKLFITVLLFSLLLAGCANSGDDTVADVDDSWNDADYAEMDEDYDYVDDSYEDEYEDDYEDEDDSIDEAEEKVVEEMPHAKASGIIAMLYDRSEGETIISINPDNGQVQHIAHFPRITDTGLWMSIPESSFSGDGRGYANLRHMFSDDYSKRTESKSLEDGSIHAGWIDTDGNFFDVSEAVGDVPESDFEERPNHNAMGFTWDGLFAYRVFDAQIDATYHVVDPNNLSTSSYEELTTKSGDKWDARAFTDKRWIIPTDWLDDTRCLADVTYKPSHGYDEHMIGGIGRLAYGSGKNIIYDTASGEITEYVPTDNQARSCWSGVISPDGEKIAFFSKMASSTDVELYITSPDGGEPTIVEIDAPDELNLKVDLENKNQYGAQSYIYCMLLDWK